MGCAQLKQLPPEIRYGAEGFAGVTSKYPRGRPGLEIDRSETWRTCGHDQMSCCHSPQSQRGSGERAEGKTDPDGG